MKFFYFLSFSILVSCSFKNPNKTIIIRGIVKDIPSNKVYITDAYHWEVLQDSANYINDTFSFHLSPVQFEPHAITICFFDSTGKRRVLAIENYLLSTDSSKYAETAFIVDRGVTTISGTYNNHPTIKSDKLKIVGSKQNHPFFRTHLSDFGWINTKDTIKRGKIINNYKNLIRQYPYSYYFIQMLYEYRTQYTKEELTNMLSLFNDEIQHHSSYTKKLSFYFKEMPSPGKPLLDYSLKDTSGSLQNILQPSSKLNMIIFWASWCGPCRQEIPELKKIYTEFENKNINMVSVSIDSDSSMWRSALAKEQMDWRQLLVDDSLIDKVKSSFNFSVIPLVIFTDSKGVEIIRYAGFESENKNTYKSFIERYLKNF